MSGHATRLIALSVALFVIGSGVVEWNNAVWRIPGPPARAGKETVVLIPAGTSVHVIAGKMEDSGVLRHRLVFEFDLRVRGLAGRMKAGEYAIPGHASMADIAAILVAGKSVEHKLTIPEGLTAQMIYALVAADPMLAGNAGPVPAEGSLLPETYLFTRGTPRASLLARMHDAQVKLLARVWPSRAQGLPYASEAQAVILASIVEKESALPEERRHIASVFLNRLARGMKLQSDPTIVYGLTKGYPLGHEIRQSELTGATPYNTYFIDGLPPTPICNPGRDSIEAVLQPEQSDDLYFVANGTGGHVFAATIAEHAKNVAAWRAIQHDRAAPAAAPSVPAPGPPARRRRIHA